MVLVNDAHRTYVCTICENQDKKWMACVCHSHSVVSPSGKQSLSSQRFSTHLVKGYDASSLVSPKEDYLDLVRKLNAHEHGEPKYILLINWTKTKMYNSVDKRPPAILPDHVFKFAYSLLGGFIP